MASEETMNMMIEDKVTSLKEELEEMIEEVKNDVDDRGSELVSNRELQNQSFNKLDKSMDKLRKELKQFGKEEEYTKKCQWHNRPRLLNLMHLQIWPPVGAICVGCKFGQQVLPLAQDLNLTALQCIAWLYTVQICLIL